MTVRMTRRRFLGQCGKCAMVCAGSAFFHGGPLVETSLAAPLKKGAVGRKPSPYFTVLGDRKIRCDLCPRYCEMGPGERGFCGVRENAGGGCDSLVYGNPCAIHVDPTEKKPLYHVLPASRSFCIATAGCNLDCKFCQNWEVSQSRPEETLNYLMSPEEAVKSAERYDCRIIAHTYVEPVVFAEYMTGIGRIAKTRGRFNVMHSAGYINPEPFDDICPVLDAACIDLKGFSETFYRDMTGGSLEPVLNTLKHLKRRNIHTEIANLLIPGKNDDGKTIRAMSRWIRNELGEDTPLHFLRFYPRYKLKSVPPTPVSALEKARTDAMSEGLNFVYIGNIPEHTAEHTYCPRCKKMLVRRIGFKVDVLNLKDGQCGDCGRTIPGIWG